MGLDEGLEFGPRCSYGQGAAVHAARPDNGWPDWISQRRLPKPCRPTPPRLLDPVLPTDPLDLYRFYEICRCTACRSIIMYSREIRRWHLSAIDFTLNVEKIEDPGGAPSVQVSMCGQVLPYKKW